MKTTRLAIIVLLWLGMWGEGALAATCTSVATGNWSAGGTWSGCGGGTPGAADTAIIANTHTVTANVAITVGAVTVNAGGTLAVAGSNFTVNGATNVSGTLSHTNTGGSETYIGLVTINAGGVWDNAIGESIVFQGGLIHNGTTFTSGTLAANGRMTFSTNNQAIGGASAINFVRVRVSGAITLTNNNTNIVTVIGTLDGTVTGSTFVNGANSTLNYSNATVPMATGPGVLTASAAGNTVNYTGAAQTVKLPSGAPATYYNLTFSGSGIKTMPATAMTVTGNFTMSGTATATSLQAMTVGGNFSIGATNSFTAGTFNHSVAGNFTLTAGGTFNSASSTFTFNGTSAVTPQTLTGAATFTNMTVNNTGIGLQLANDITVTTAAAGTLILTDGNIDTQAFTLIITRDCNVAGLVQRLVGTSGWIAGNLRKRIPTGAPVSCTFEIGDATTYRPVNTTFASVTTAGNVTGWSNQAPGGDHPDTSNLLSGVDPLLSVNRYWTLTNSGTVFTTCSATFNYVAGDLDGGTTPASFIIARGSSCSGSGVSRTCTSWAQLTPSPAATSTQATATLLTAFGDFAVGQPKAANFSREPQFIYTRELY